MSNPSFESWPLNAQTAKVLGLPSAALTPSAELMANHQEWVWFEPAAQVAIGQGPAWQHGFPATSLEEALQCMEQRTVG